MAHNFLNMIIWKKSMDFTVLIYKYNQDLRSSERFNLIDQMNGYSCRIPLNITEGSRKRTKKHFAKSLLLSSAFELQTQLLICQRRNYGKNEDLKASHASIIKVQKMISSFKENFE